MGPQRIQPSADALCSGRRRLGPFTHQTSMHESTSRRGGAYSLVAGDHRASDRIEETLNSDLAAGTINRIRNFCIRLCA